jgi:3-(3-hydroxy-phenyl)propionate hydroxylase
MPDDPLAVPTTLTATVTGDGVYELPVYPFVEPAEIGGKLGRHAVVIVGAGLTGLTAACDFALRGIPAVVIDEDNTVGVRGAASRGICYAQKSLEIFRRLGIYERVRAKGVQWSVGRTLAGADEVYAFDLKQAATHNVSQQPAFINLQQFYIEWYLVDRIYELGTVELRWQNKLVDVAPARDHVRLTIDTPAGRYEIETQWLLDCTGSHSPVAAGLGVGASASKVLDRWCISDVRLAHRPPAERWPWIEAPFNDDRAVWQHLMADDVWRLDYQLAPDADPDQAASPAVVEERLRRQFGADVRYDLVWVGPYAYRSRCLDAFRVGRVLFAGDAAHVMSPFGARGGNSGVQDADNLVWKLALVLEGRAPEALLDSYAEERRFAAQDNIRITGRTTRFLSPATKAERLARDAVISLAREYPFARGFVNTGRLSTPTCYTHSPLNVGAGGGRHVQNAALVMPNGVRGDLVALLALADDALLGFVIMPLDTALADELERLEQRYPVRFFCLRAEEGSTCVFPTVIDIDGHLADQVGADVNGIALVRPDLHLAGLLEAPSPKRIEAAVRTVLAMN